MGMLPARFLTIHCAATPEGRDVKAATISAWDIAKFGQVSYHHVVELDGTAVQTLPDDKRGAHVGGKNTGNIGICYVGGMDAKMAKPKDTRTAAQKATLRRLVTEYQAKYPGIIVRGHREWPGVAKACPSFDVQAWLKAEGLTSVPA
jgi:N-acetylmuramoyl-L-alanine amidase